MNIVAGVAPRADGQAALDRAVEEAERRGAHLHLVRAMGGTLSENPGRARDWAGEVTTTRDELEQLSAGLEDRGVEVTLHLDPVGSDPATTILEVAAEVDANLIVIGVRHRSPVGKLVMGSTSQDVILKADCPVLAVKPS